MSTPHNQANKGDIAKTVLMPGDPLRAKYLAETYLENVKQFNATRNMFGYTGTYKGKEVSIMGSGMGMPSIGIYSYELFHFYDVENIIRIGSCGSFKEDVRLRDIIIVQGACTDSNYAHQYELPGTYSAISDYSLLEKAVEKAKEKNLSYHVGNVLSSDLFYHADNKADKWIKMGCLATEMESYALFATAAHLDKKALTLLTVSDSLVTQEETTAEEREKTFTAMMEVALEIAQVLTKFAFFDFDDTLIHGEVKGLRLVGNASIALAWENGKLTRCAVTADQAYEGEVVYGEMRQAVKLEKGETVMLDAVLEVKYQKQ